MSEKQEHKRRYNLRLQYIAEFQKWLDNVLASADRVRNRACGTGGV